MDKAELAMTSVLCHNNIMLFFVQLYQLSIFNSAFKFVQWYGAVHVMRGHQVLLSCSFRVYIAIVICTEELWFKMILLLLW